MKALRYLLIAVALLSVMSVGAQGLAEQPEIQMQSTSVMQGSGSTLPSAAVEGISMTNEQVASPANAPSGPRRGRPGDWTDPYKDPLGDAMLPLALLAIAYCAGCMVYKRRKRSA